MTRTRQPRGRRSTLVYGLVLLGIAVGLDAIGVSSLSSRFTGVAVWLAIMAVAILSRLRPLGVSHSATPGEGTRPAISVVALLAIAAAGVPIVYLLGRVTALGSILEAALIVLVVVIVARSAASRQAGH